MQSYSIFFQAAAEATPDVSFTPEAAATTVTQPVTAPAVAPDGTPEVLTGIAATAMVIITMLVMLITKWLRTKFKVDAENTQLDSTKSLMEQRNFLIDHRLIPFAISTAEHWLLTQLPTILRDLTDGDGFEWGTHWRHLRTYTRQRVLAKFLAENIDIVKVLGEKELDDILDRWLLKLVSKLPHTVQAYIPEGLLTKSTDILTKKLTEFVISHGNFLLKD